MRNHPLSFTPDEVGMTKKMVRIPIRRPGEPRPEVEVIEDNGMMAENDKTSDITAAGETFPTAETADQPVDWCDRALRLQAEMDNYRKRQQKLAEERVAREKGALLEKFLGVVDNLERIIAHLRPDDSYDQSVRVAYDALLNLLRAEDVTPLETAGVPFDPAWHEAVGTTPAPPDQEADMVVIAEEKRGYRWGDRLLRPAQVIVAQK